MMQSLDSKAKLCGFLAIEIAHMSESASPEARPSLEMAAADLLRAKTLIYRAKNNAGEAVEGVA